MSASGRREMQDNGSADAGGNRNDRTPPSIRKNANGKYRQDGQ
jgi:hypothetical protein